MKHKPEQFQIILAYLELVLDLKVLLIHSFPIIYFMTVKLIKSVLWYLNNL